MTLPLPRSLLLCAVLVGCGDINWGGGTAIGNPTTAVRLAPDDDQPWDIATARTVEATVERCGGKSRSTTWTDVDLIAGPPLEWPLGGELCRIELVITGLSANGSALTRDSATLDLDLPSLVLDAADDDLLLELGDRSDPADIERRSGLYRERIADGVLDSLERSDGALAASADRQPDPVDVPVLAVVGEPEFATVFLAEDVDYPQNDGPEKLFDVAWSSDRIVAVGGEDIGIAQVSSDQGLTWEPVTLPQSTGSITLSNQVFYAAGFPGGIQQSTDGLAWTLVAETGLVTQGIAAGPDALVSVGGGGVAHSPNGTDWTRIDLPGAPSLWGIGWGPPGWVATGEGGTRWFSDDGLDWVETDTGGQKLTSVTWTGTEYIATGENEVWSSPDGQAWTALPAKRLYDTAMHDGVLYGVDERFVFRSDDAGVTWELWREAEDGQFLNALASSVP